MLALSDKWLKRDFVEDGYCDMIDPDCKNKEDKRSIRCLAILMVIFLAGRLINFVEAHFTISFIIFPV